MRNIGCLLVLVIVVAMLLFGVSVYRDMNKQTRMFVAGMVPPVLVLVPVLAILLLVMVRLVTSMGQREADFANELSNMRINGGQAPAVVVMPGGSEVKQLTAGYGSSYPDHAFPTEGPNTRRLKFLGQ